MMNSQPNVHILMPSSMSPNTAQLLTTLTDIDCAEKLFIRRMIFTTCSGRCSLRTSTGWQLCTAWLHGSPNATMSSGSSAILDMNLSFETWAENLDSNFLHVSIPRPPGPQNWSKVRYVSLTSKEVRTNKVYTTYNSVRFLETVQLLKVLEQRCLPRQPVCNIWQSDRWLAKISFFTQSIYAL